MPQLRIPGDRWSMKQHKYRFILLLLVFIITTVPAFAGTYETTVDAFSYGNYEIPAYDGDPSEVVNGNLPTFSAEELYADPYVYYGDLDELGRCTGACALVGPETLPREERGNIGMIKPTGWHTVKYDGIEGNYLYNRCHLIGFQLTGQDANEKNLITGTRYLNVEGMLPYEDSVLAYVTGTGNHVLYRVTPVFRKDNLLADGVLMEARSVEDPLVQFCAFCYNVQPGITIDYATGESTGPAFTGNDSNGNGDGKSRDEGDGDTSAGISSGGGGKEESPSAGISAGGEGKEESPSAGNTVTRSGQSGREETPGKTETPGERMRNGDWRFIVNVSTGKFHLPGCESVRKMSEKNKQGFNGSREELIEMGYEPCKNCNP